MQDNTPKPNQATAEPLTVDLFKVLGNILRPLNQDEHEN